MNNVITAEPSPERENNSNLENKRAMEQVWKDIDTLLSQGISLDEAIDDVYAKYKGTNDFPEKMSKILVDYLQKEIELANNQKQLNSIWAEIEQLTPGVYFKIFKKHTKDQEEERYLV